MQRTRLFSIPGSRFRPGRAVLLAAALAAATTGSALAPAWAEKPPDKPSAPVVAAPRASSPEAAALDQRILAAAKGSEIMANLTYLSDVIGPRLTGSVRLKRAADWAADRMRSAGLSNVHLETWLLPVGWERGTAEARVLEPHNGHHLTLASMAWAPGTKGKVVGDVVILKARKSADLKPYKGKLKNAIVLQGEPAHIQPITEKGLGLFGAPGGRRGGAGGLSEKAMLRMFQEMMAFRKEATDFLRAEGVSAVFLDAGKPHGLLNMTGGWRGTDRPVAADAVPTAFVAHEDYAMLYRLASRPAPARTRVELEMENKIIPGPVRSYNVIGDLRGKEKPDEFVVLGAHLDSWDLAEGTTDNGTGTCVVLEAARILGRSGIQPRRTIRFALFSGEEQGLHGSKAYVKEHKDEMPRTSMCVVHDLGTGKVTGIGLSGYEATKPILERELTALKKLGLTEFSTRRMGGSDHASFDAVGVPGFYFLQDPAEYRFTHHSQSDTLDKAKEPDLVEGAQAMAVIGLRVANLPTLLPRDNKTPYHSLF